MNGNITTENTWTYVYDLSNQLIRVLQGGNQVGEYTFNGVGQRIKKVTQTETRIFHYDLWGHLIAETNQSGQMLADYVYLRDQLLAMIKPGEQAYYFHNDHLGTPQVLTSDSQAIVWKAAYTPFGEAVTSVATVENPFRFPGQYYDSETGLHYNYFRYYNPPVGRYLTPDPIGLEGGINLFSYVRGNPLRWVDPLGLQTIPLAFPRILLRPIPWTIPKPGTFVDPIIYFDPGTIDMTDTRTWPKPPTNSKCKEGPPSRNKPRERGEKSLWDEEGGEWRIQKPDEYHQDPHWNYKGPGPNSPWQNVPMPSNII